MHRYNGNSWDGGNPPKDRNRRSHRDRGDSIGRDREANMPVYRLSVEGLCGGQEMVNVQHYITRTSEPTLDGFLDEWEHDVQDAYLACVASQYQLVQLIAREVGTVMQVYRSVNLNGALTGELCPLQSSPVLALRTAQANRSGRGRTYIPTIREADQTDGLIAGPHITRLVALAQALLASPGMWDNYALAVYSRLTGFAFQVTDILVRQYVFTQRRRARGQGQFVIETPA